LKEEKLDGCSKAFNQGYERLGKRRTGAEKGARTLEKTVRQLQRGGGYINNADQKTRKNTFGQSKIEIERGKDA